MTTDSELEKAAKDYALSMVPVPTVVDKYYPGLIDGFLAGAKWQAEREGWISVKERLPEIGAKVLWQGAYSKSCQFIGQLNNSGSYGGYLYIRRGDDETRKLDDVTHWRELLAAPKKEGE